MDEEPNTSAPVADDAGAQALPAEPAAPVEAGEQPTAEPSEPSPDAEPGAPEIDEELQKYAKSQGIELDSPGAIKAAEVARKAQSEATRNYHKASELEKGMTDMSDASAQQVAEATGQDPEVLKRLQRMEVKETIRDFWNEHPDARQYEKRITEIAQTAGLYGTPEAILKAAHAMALAEKTAASPSTGALKFEPTL